MTAFTTNYVVLREVVKKKKEIPYEIGWDRKRSLCIVYNTAKNIVATGICVESAVKAFQRKAKNL